MYEILFWFFFLIEVNIFLKENKNVISREDVSNLFKKFKLINYLFK